MLKLLFIYCLVIFQFQSAFASSATLQSETLSKENDLYGPEHMEKVSHSLAVSQRDVLESFFRAFFANSEGGYVLYGQKPVCTEGVMPPGDNLLMIGDPLHRKSILFKEGLKIWSPYSLWGKNYFVQYHQKLNYGWQKIYLINRQEFTKTVEQNLHLFRYVLGPSVTPQSLFAQFMNAEESISSVLKDDKVLIGIILGFGVDNSIYGSRLEMISQNLSKNETIPFKPIQARSQEKRKKGVFDKRFKHLTPSFSYSSLEEELNLLEKNHFISKDLVKLFFPTFPWFACLKSNETKQLISSYSKSQKKVADVFNSSNFLKEVLFRIFEDKKETVKALKALSSAPAFCEKHD